MKELVHRIQQSQRIVVISHIHPDGDAVGSTLGLFLALKQLGKDVHGVLRDGVPKIFSFLEGYEGIENTLPLDADLYIVLDASDALRTGFVEQIKALSREKKLAFIDHHPKGDLMRLASFSVHRTTASSAAELVYEVIQELEVKLTSSIATALLTGMYTDTGGFQFPNTSNFVLEYSAELMRRGAQLNKIVQHISHQKSMVTLKLLGIALEKLLVTQKGSVAVSALTQADIQECGATPEDLTGIVNELNVLPQVEFSLLLSEVDLGEVRGSLRTADGKDFNVGRIASLLGGGGHPRAAGFSVPGHLVALPEGGWRVEPFLVS